MIFGAAFSLLYLIIIGCSIPQQVCPFSTPHGFSLRNQINIRNVRMSLSKVVGGSVVALVTPMTENNAVDFPRFIELLQWHMKEGTDGAVILGTTGEYSMISMEERTQIIKTAAKTINKAFPIIVGTGTIETSKVIEYSKNALENGADASLVITPYYVKPPQRALIKHYLTIADAVPLPMIVYNAPGRTGVDMKPEALGEIAKHPNIIGVKDATGDLDRVQSIRKLCGPDFLIFSGEDDSGCEFVRLGGDGVISVTANVAPKLMHQMLSDSKAGKRSEAEAVNNSLMLIHERLFLESNPIPVKKALEFMGKIGPGIRPPLAPLASKYFESLKEALKKGNAL